MIKNIFEKQLYHLLILLFLILGLFIITQKFNYLLTGNYFGFSSIFWFSIAVLTPIVHQIYVMLCWRFELHTNLITRFLGKKGFTLYLIIFFILFIGRIIFLLLLAISNKNTFYLSPYVRYGIIFIFSIITLYSFYSVAVYFGMKRAAGFDHFDYEVAALPFVNKGIFRFTNNAMYVWAFLIMYLPAFIFLSWGAFIAAIFCHIYIWVHYYFTELPDIKRIYSKRE